MQFGNNISSNDTHSNQYAAGTASEQSFGERQEIEKNREVIKAYNQSPIAQNFTARNEYSRVKPRNIQRRKSSRQEMNAVGGAVPERPGVQRMSTRPHAGFHEPPARGYNPYG